jgi:hypothetical protein
MKLFITLLSFWLLNISYGQEQKDRYEAVYYELHTLRDFDLKGNVQQVITEHLEPKGEENELAPAFIGKTELNFNEEGLLTSSFEIKSDGDTFDYKYFTYNLKEQLTKVESKNVFFTYAYDKAGNLIVMQYHNKGTIRYTRKLSYDGLNRLLTDQMFSGLDPVFTDEYTYVNKTDQILTCVTKVHPYQGFNERTETKTYAYHKNGSIKSISKVANSTGSTLNNYIRTYNESGDLLTYVEGDPDFDPASLNEQYTYNSDGNLVKLHAYYVYLGEGDMLSDNRYLYEWDATKNWVEYTIMSTSAWSLENKAKEITDVQEKIVNQKKRTITYYK